MKKTTKILLIILIVVVLLIALFCPLTKNVALDGGSTFYSATLYTVVKWNNGYTATRVYWFHDNFKSYEELMEIEKAREDYWDYVPNKMYNLEYGKIVSES